MQHVNLDVQDEAVKRFFMSLTLDSVGSVLEIDGKAVACVVLPPIGNGTSRDENWTSEKNNRRCELIDKKYDEGLSAAEVAELSLLQEEAIHYRRRVAPLPLDHARKLNQELLELAASKQV